MLSLLKTLIIETGAVKKKEDYYIGNINRQKDKKVIISMIDDDIIVIKLIKNTPD